MVLLRVQRLLGCSIAIALVFGCAMFGSSAPILNVPDTAYGTRLDIEDASTRVARAARFLGWDVEVQGERAFIAVRNKAAGKHVAQVLIEFDEDSFSIAYRNSVQLGYDGENIHELYNLWVETLRDAIATETAAPGR